MKFKAGNYFIFITLLVSILFAYLRLNAAENKTSNTFCIQAANSSFDNQHNNSHPNNNIIFEELEENEEEGKENFHDNRNEFYRLEITNILAVNYISFCGILIDQNPFPLVLKYSFNYFIRSIRI